MAQTKPLSSIKNLDQINAPVLVDITHKFADLTGGELILSSCTRDKSRVTVTGKLQIDEDQPQPESDAIAAYTNQVKEEMTNAFHDSLASNTEKQLRIDPFTLGTKDATDKVTRVSLGLREKTGVIISYKHGTPNVVRSPLSNCPA